ncbi:RHS repeat domain-containing protein [Steroidobacter cummioxidans]|uniref:RHS repeat domain-containing protein n=1 Tax=Steroidobacter cummioxidans TaxID=1803913 RepID=UPI000E323904|nr:RHS repeat-associated core domain-containing protein [Steroidobacter cummioxidans]
MARYFASSKRYVLVALSVIAVCPAGAYAQVLDMAPSPAVSVLDHVGVDLKSGSIVRQIGTVTLGPVDAPKLDFPILSTSFIFSGSTPVYGVSSSQCAGTPNCAYHNQTWTMQGKSETFLLSPASTTAPRPYTEQGSKVSGTSLIRQDGTVWAFGDGGGATLPPGVTGVVASVTYPNGEKLTHNYSNGELRSVTSNAGYMIHFQSFKPYLGGMPSKVTLINLKTDYCAPLAASCTGLTVNWPSATFTTTSSNNTRTTVAKDNLNRESSSAETTTTVPSGAGIDRFTTMSRFVTPQGRWVEFQRLVTSYRFPTSDGTTCSTRSVLQWAKTAAGQWNYTFPGSDDCHYTRVYGVVSTSPDGASERFQTGLHTDQLGRDTSYVTGSVNTIFGPIELDVGTIVKPEGNRFAFGRDERRNLTQTTATAKSGGDTILARAVYGPTSACTATTTKICNQPEYTIDANGNRTDYTYYAEHGGVNTKTLPPDVDGVRAVLTYTYEQKSARYKNGPSTFINGAPIWKLTRFSRCKQGTSCAGTANEVIVTYGYDDNLLLTTETIRDGAGAVFSSNTKTYDSVGNLIEVDGPLPGAVDKVYSFYDDARQKIGEIGIDPDGAGPLPRPATRTSYNDDGQPTYVYAGTTNGTTLADLNAMSVVRYIHTQYDDLGRANIETVVAGGVTQRITQYSHDFRGKVLCTAVRMNPSVYGSLPTDACAPSIAGVYGPDRITQNVYNAAGELTQVIQGVGTPLRRTYATYKYTDNGLPQDWVDANGNRTHLTYDGFDRLDTTYFPSPTRASAFNPATPESALASANAYNTGDYEKFEYYPGGNRRTWRRRDGAVIGYAYDGQNRQISRDLPGGSDQDVYTDYDLLGNVTSRRFTSRSGPGITYVTDAMGRVTSTTDMNGRTLGYGYNEASGRVRVTYPDNNYIGYQLDYANRITNFGWNALTGLYSQSFDALGRLSTMTKGSGTTSFDYHPVGYVSSMVNNFAGSVNDITWLFPTYNPVGQMVAQNTSSDLYDYVESAVLTTGKSYDGLNRDAAIAALANGYDARGNLRNDGVRSFTYDIENKLLTATGGSANLTLTYDPEGRISKYRSGTNEITFVYDGADLVAEYSSGGVMLRRYVHGSGTDDPILWLEGAGNSDRRYLYANHQGSVIAYADAAGNRQAVYKYGPYGEPKDASNNESWDGFRLRYTGQLILPEAKLYYYKARVYDPVFGRFLQTDPVGAQDDLNMYAYVRNDPVNKSDPTGTICTGDTQVDARCTSDYFNGIPMDKAKEAGMISNRMQGKIDRYDKSATEGYKKAMKMGDDTVKVKAFANAPEREVSGNRLAQKMRETKVNIETREGNASDGKPYQSTETAGGYAGAYLRNDYGVEYLNLAMISVVNRALNLPDTPAHNRTQSGVMLHEAIHLTPGMYSRDPGHQNSFRNAVNQILDRP